MQNSTFDPRNVSEFDKNNMNKSAIGVTGTATHGTDTNIDYTLADDMILAGGHICYVKNAKWGDSVSFQILSGSTVLKEFITNWPINPDEYRQDLPTANYPAKLITGLKLRVIYHSVASVLEPSPEVAIGYNFEKLIV